jgi:hypothetical protein
MSLAEAFNFKKIQCRTVLYIVQVHSLNVIWYMRNMHAAHLSRQVS